MPRKSHQFRINKSDREVFKTCARAGYITQALASEYLDSGKGRLDKLVREGYLKPKITMVEGKQTKAYRLTGEGKEYVRNNEPSINGIYGGHSIKHELELAKQLLQYPQEIRDLSLTEQDLKNEYSYIRGQQSPPDLIIRHYVEIEKQLVLLPTQIIEITTNRYGQQEINEKQAFITQIMGIPVTRMEEVLTYVRI